MNKLKLSDGQRLNHLREYLIDESCMIDWKNKDYLQEYCGTTDVQSIMESLINHAMSQETVLDLYDNNSEKYFHLLTEEQLEEFNEVEGKYTRDELINSFMMFEEKRAFGCNKLSDGLTDKALVSKMFNVYMDMSTEKLRIEHEAMFDLLYDEHGSVIMSEKGKILADLEANKDNLWV